MKKFFVFVNDQCLTNGPVSCKTVCKMLNEYGYMYNPQKFSFYDEKMNPTTANHARFDDIASMPDE